MSHSTICSTSRSADPRNSRASPRSPPTVPELWVCGPARPQAVGPPAARPPPDISPSTRWLSPRLSGFFVSQPTRRQLHGDSRAATPRVPRRARAPADALRPRRRPAQPVQVATPDSEGAGWGRSERIATGTGPAGLSPRPGVAPPALPGRYRGELGWVRRWAMLGIAHLPAFPPVSNASWLGGCGTGLVGAGESPPERPGRVRRPGR